MDHDEIIEAYQKVLENLPEQSGAIEGVLFAANVFFLFDIRHLPFPKKRIEEELLEQLDLLDDFGYVSDLETLGTTKKEIEEFKFATCKCYLNLALFQDLGRGPINSSEISSKNLGTENPEIKSWINEIHENTILPWMLLGYSTQNTKEWVPTVMNEWDQLKCRLSKFYDENDIRPPH